MATTRSSPGLRGKPCSAAAGQLPPPPPAARRPRRRALAASPPRNPSLACCGARPARCPPARPTLGQVALDPFVEVDACLPVSVLLQPNATREAAYSIRLAAEPAVLQVGVHVCKWARASAGARGTGVGWPNHADGVRRGAQGPRGRKPGPACRPRSAARPARRPFPALCTLPGTRCLTTWPGNPLPSVWDSPPLLPLPPSSSTAAGAVLQREPRRRAAPGEQRRVHRHPPHPGALAV